MYEDMNAKDDVFIPLALMTQNDDGHNDGVPDEDDLTWWMNYPDPPLTYPILADPNGSVSRAWDINYYTPFNFILDKDNVCRYKIIGYWDSRLRGVIEDLLEE